MTDNTFVTLPNRGLIHVEGEDRVEFLQGLISQNVERLAEQHIMYGCLLTPQGKFLHDFFLHHGDGFILLDCEGGERAQDLYKRLNLYKLRSKVQLSVEEVVPVYASINHEHGLKDPRHNDMGYRSFEKPDINEVNFEEWDKHRITLGVPDGSRDMALERSTLLECNIDKVNGVDFNKGCYMGQELTARMHFRNLGKKHLVSLEFKDMPSAPFTEVTLGDKLIGNMRSSCGNIGLAVIKDEFLEGLNDDKNPIRLLG